MIYIYELVEKDLDGEMYEAFEKWVTKIENEFF